MPNWCATNWRIQGSPETVQKIADTFNSLYERPREHESDFGPLWLANLWCVLLNKTIEEAGRTHENLRGNLDPNPYGVACMFKEDPDPDARFETVPLEDGRLRLAFTTQSAWSYPAWLDEYFGVLQNDDDMFEYGWKATDEFGNFHQCRNGALMGGVYEVEGFDIWESFDVGEEVRLAEFVGKIVGKTFDESKIIEGDYSELNAALDEYREANPDKDIYIHIYDEL